MDQDTKCRNRLLDILQQRINPSELRELVFRVLGFCAYEDLAGQNHTERCIAFLQTIKRHQKEGDFFITLVERRKDIDLAVIAQALIECDDEGRISRELANSPQGRCLLQRLPGLPPLLRSQAGIYDYAQPPLLPPPQSTDKQLQTWLESHGMLRIPFGALQAEMEPELFNFFVYPDHWESVVSPRPCWFWGASGSGHSAMTLMFQYNCQTGAPGEDERGFAVHCQDLSSGYPAWLLKQILVAVGRAMIGFMSRNPYGLLAYPLEQQKQGATLIRTALLNAKDLWWELSRSELALGQNAGLWITRLEETQPLPNFSAEMVMDWLPFAIPMGFKRLYLLLETKQALSPTTRSILENWAMQWQANRIYLKILEKCETPPAVTGVELWPLSVSLVEILQRRLSWVTERKVKNLQQLCTRDIDDADKLLWDAAQGSPRQLIRLGNELFKYWIQSGKEKLEPDHFRQAGLL